MHKLPKQVKSEISALNKIGRLFFKRVRKKNLVTIFLTQVKQKGQKMKKITKKVNEATN